MFFIVSPQVKSNCIREIQTLPLGKFYVGISEKKRSNCQNRLWHKWVTIMANEKGYSQEDMKHLLKLHIIGTTDFINQKTGEVVERVKSSSELSVSEFTELMDGTFLLATQEGIQLPTPDYYGV